jgi:hypothetical protein
MRSPIHLLVLIILLIGFLSPINSEIVMAGSQGDQIATIANSPTYASLNSQNVIHVPGDVASLQGAINQVQNGEVIELTGGVYYTSDGPFMMNNLEKGFTIRAASGATVVLDGEGKNNIIRFQNSDSSRGRPILFQGLTFAHGFTGTEGTAGGVTMYEAQSTFLDCDFHDNVSNVSTTVGGAIYIAEHSTAFFIDSTWQNNSSRLGGGGLGVRSGSEVYIHNSQFIHNIANPPNHNRGSSGGAINLGNSIARISNTRFENNQAGAYGGALYSIGNWQTPLDQPQADVIIANSTFINNQAVRDPSVNETFPTEGGAINTEDQSRLQVYNSRFITNSAMIGGGVNVYRANVTIRNSTFLGNRATGNVFQSSFGGSISVNSADGADNGSTNWPASNLTVENTLIQGRYGSVSTVAQTGGCVFAGGDGNRIDGDPSVPDMGTVEENRAQVTIRNVVLYDCDVTAASPNSGVGGALLVAVAHLTLEDSMVMNSDALGNSASGGGVGILFNSLADIKNTTIANNTSGQFGGGVFVQGSTVTIDSSKIIGNEVSPGITEGENASFGAGLFTAPDEVRNLNISGTVQNSVFSENKGMAVFDDDRTTGPINEMHYNSNHFYATTFGDKVYKDSLSASQNVSGLNSFVVVRDNGTSTTKSDVPNSQYSNRPILGAILGVPTLILPGGAAGEPNLPTTSYLGFAWSGGSATLDGSNLATSSGLKSTSAVGEHSLVVSGNTYKTSLSQAENPSAALNVSTSGTTTTLNWDLLNGTFLDSALDQGLTIPSTPSGSVQVQSSVERQYHFYAITREGGAIATANSGTPVLFVPVSFKVLAGLNLQVNQGSLSVINNGGGVMTWTASSGTPNLITIDTPNSDTQSIDSLIFSLNIEGLAPGQYQGYIDIDAGDAGSQRVTIVIKVVSDLRQIFLPVALK